ncbi:MAG: hypothetical protein QY323_05680 [Patescibacteria group bacterium]|nr:MAG: hypothetical protein QY323_05680 [Patescibacteria group bacterium]
MVIESSKDILFVVLAFCAVWFTIFVCWALYYVIGMLRDASYIMREIHDKISAIDKAIHAVREKVETSFGSFGIAAAGLKMLGGYLDKRKDKVAAKAEKVAAKLKKKAAKVKKRIKEELEEDTD